MTTLPLTTSPGGRGDCQRVRQTVRESGRLSESHTDCHCVRESGRLSESRADCQRVGQTVRESYRLSESRADCQRVGKTVRAAIVTNLVLKPHAEACCFGLSSSIVAKASLCWEIVAIPDVTVMTSPFP